MVEHVRLLAIDISLLSFLWTKTISIANFLVNRSSTKANLGVIVKEKYTCKKLHVHHLKIFGCVPYLHIPKEQIKKLENKTRCLFLGYDEHSKVYSLYDSVKKKIVLSRDVTFDKSKIEISSPPIQEDILPILNHNLNYDDDFSHDPLTKSNPETKNP